MGCGASSDATSSTDTLSEVNINSPTKGLKGPRNIFQVDEIIEVMKPKNDISKKSNKSASSSSSSSSNEEKESEKANGSPSSAKSENKNQNGESPSKITNDESNTEDTAHSEEIQALRSQYEDIKNASTEGEDKTTLNNENFTVSLLNLLDKMSKDIKNKKNSTQNTGDSQNVDSEKIEELEYKLEEATETNKGRMTTLEEHVDHVDQLARKHDLILSGPGVPTDNEKLKKAVIEKLSSSLKIPKKDLLNIKVRKIGPGRNGKPPTVLLTHYNTETRGLIFSAAHKAKPTDIFINESVTRKRENLMYELRKFKKEGKLKSVYSLNGYVYVVYPDGGRKQVNNLYEVKL